MFAYVSLTYVKHKVCFIWIEMTLYLDLLFF